MATILSVRPEEGARRIAIGFIHEALDAGGRLDEGGDDEALHDLRVALRRLRSTLRGYRAVLRGAVSGKRKRALKELVARTGGGRDAEVQLAWVREVRGSLSQEEQVGADAWARSLRRAKEASYDDLRDELLPSLRALLGRLERDLAHYEVRFTVHEERGDESFGDLLAREVELALVDFVALLARVETLDDEATAHEARIVGKRLRYLLEPVRESVEPVDAVLKQLKRVQEQLGELQDLAIRTTKLSEAMERAAIERARNEVDLVVNVDHDAAAEEAELVPGLEPGLLALLRLAQARKVALFEELAPDWLGTDAPERAHLQRAIEGLAHDVLRSSRKGAPREIERKYLLSGIPPEVRGRPYARLEQGYVPGEAIIERVRKKVDGAGTRYFRTVKLGRGIERIEIEERISASLYSALFALTEGKRVKKRRYAIEEDGLVWELDVFTDRELVLCEVELESADRRPTLPAWLEPFVVREVTDEDTYVNANLAK